MSNNWEGIRKEWETTDITFKALSEKYGIKDSTIRSRKNREKWQRNATTKNATQRKNVATKKSKGATKRKQRNRSGNPNPKNQFTKRNSVAVTHGFFSKYLPQESLDIMEQAQEMTPDDMIWDQIMIQYAAIVRAQNIMFVTDKNEMIKELKKQKFEIRNFGDRDVKDYRQVPVEEEYEFQFAWDRHANFMNAQSRAMSEFRSLIKQFLEMAHEDDERRLRLEQMQLGIEKTEAEIGILKGDGDKKGAEDWVSALQKVADRRRQAQERQVIDDEQ